MTRSPQGEFASSDAQTSPASAVDVSVVIVNYNVCEFLVQAIRSVQQASRNLTTEIWVVDNNSIDDSVETVRRDFPNVHVIANQENAGFGTANNQAIQQSRGEFVFILNPDTIVQEDTLEKMVACMGSHPDCGALGCQILNPDGTFAPESRRAFPTPQIAFWRMTGLGRLFPKSRRFGGYNMTHPAGRLVDLVYPRDAHHSLQRREHQKGRNPLRAALLWRNAAVH
jgi:GT2 family glycosyltransferase